MKILTILPSLVLLASCAPIPNTTGIAPEITGYVMDATSNIPIENAKIEYIRGKYHDSTETDESGKFCAGPLKQWHYLIYIGSPGRAPFPDILNYIGHCPAMIKVSASGYMNTNCSLQIESSCWFESPWCPEEQEDEVSENEDYESWYDFKYGEDIIIKLKKANQGMDFTGKTPVD